MWTTGECPLTGMIIETHGITGTDPGTEAPGLGIPTEVHIPDTKGPEIWTCDMGGTLTGSLTVIIGETDTQTQT